jgi:predicted DNA-binding transcriptional regulator AlpA
MQDEIYTADQLAVIFSRSPRTIWKWAATGKIPKGIKISHKSHYWRRSEIEHLFDDRRIA